MDVNSLTAAQLSQLKKQFDAELEHLTSSFASLRAAQAKFRDCVKSIGVGVTSPGALERPLLVPLTTSLYVPGRLASADTVLVDVGTGFYVEKSAAEAVDFYERKIKDLEASLKDLEGVIQDKGNNLRVIEDGEWLWGGHINVAPDLLVTMKVKG